jgi:hypothetical protein
MKTITNDQTGEKFEIIRRHELPEHGQFLVQCAPIPSAQKTIVQVAAEAMKYDERRYRHIYDIDCAVYDAIEQRLQAIERKLEGK